MKIVYAESFQNRLKRHISYISSYNTKAARKLKEEILQKTKSISRNPFQFRKSVYFDDDRIRDIIHKGCTIVFKVYEDKILVFGFLKHQEFPLDED